MNAIPAPIYPRYLRTPDAAVHLGLSPRTLEKHRCYGTGPVYHKIGGRIVYALADLMPGFTRANAARPRTRDAAWFIPLAASPAPVRCGGERAASRRGARQAVKARTA